MSSILVIDDDPFLRGMAAEYLIKQAHDVTTAADGASGLDCLVRNVPDLVVTDVKMPGNEEGRFILQLRRDWPAIPVIVMSGGFEESLSSFEADGCLRLVKPFTLSHLNQVVQQALGSGAGSDPERNNPPVPGELDGGSRPATDGE